MSFSLSLSLREGWIHRIRGTCSFTQTIHSEVSPRLVTQVILGFCNYPFSRTQRALLMSFSRLTRNFSFAFNQIKLSQIKNLSLTFRVRCFFRD